MRKKTPVQRADYKLFVPILERHHNKVYRWLVKEAGYTVKYLSIILDVPLNKVNPLFKNTDRLTLQQILIIIKLLKGRRSASEVLQSLFFEPMLTGINASEHIYDSIPLPSTDVQAIRSDFIPKNK